MRAFILASVISRASAAFAPARTHSHIHCTAPTLQMAQGCIWVPNGTRCWSVSYSVRVGSTFPARTPLPYSTIDLRAPMVANAGGVRLPKAEIQLSYWVCVAAFATANAALAVIFAWSFKREILRKHKKFTSNGGVFVTPLPKVEVIQVWAIEPKNSTNRACFNVAQNHQPEPIRWTRFLVK